MIKNVIATTVRSLINRCGFDVVPYRGNRSSSLIYPPDFTEANKAICEAVRPYTLTSPERINAVIESVRYVVANEIDGAMVECGVWKGGSTMAMILTLQELKDTSRDLYLYDTFSGMNAPTDTDVSFDGRKASDTFVKTKISDDASDWCLSPLDEVKKNLHSTNYPQDEIHFVMGKVEDTIPETMPPKIALLRLDTDWYESTKHELVHLFPLLQPKGVLIVDDYGHWQGVRKAVDEYFADQQIKILLHRVDYTARSAIKN